MEKGYTLVELLVVMAVFLFIIGIAVTVFLFIIENQKSILAEQKILNQLSYVEEYMSKAIRMASPEGCGNTYAYTKSNWNPATGEYSGIMFSNESDIDSSGVPICTEYFLENSVLKERKNNGEPIALTSADMKINYIRFVLDGCDPAYSYCTAWSGETGVQGRVTIAIGIQVNKNQEKVFQTTVSQRNIRK